MGLHHNSMHHLHQHRPCRPPVLHDENDRDDDDHKANTEYVQPTSKRKRQLLHRSESCSSEDGSYDDVNMEQELWGSTLTTNNSNRNDTKDDSNDEDNDDEHHHHVTRGVGVNVYDLQDQVLLLLTDVQGV